MGHALRLDHPRHYIQLDPGQTSFANLHQQCNHRKSVTAWVLVSSTHTQSPHHPGRRHLLRCDVVSASLSRGTDARETSNGWGVGLRASRICCDWMHLIRSRWATVTQSVFFELFDAGTTKHKTYWNQVDNDERRLKRVSHYMHCLGCMLFHIQSIAYNTYGTCS